MNETIKFAIEDITRFVNDENPEMAIAHINFLSTRPNSHGINVTEEILRRDAHTILGKFLVGKMNCIDSDVEGHHTRQEIFGYFPKEQEIVFTEKDGYLVASADAVISKLYATEYYDLFTKDNYRDVSVEMTTFGQLELPDGTKDIKGLNLTGCTTLGKNVNPACRDANMSIIQFSENKANEFYHNKYNSFSELKKFSEERRNKMAENKTYKINKTELKDTAWGDVDKVELKNKVMNAKNRDTLVHAVYALVEDRKSTRLNSSH